LRAHAHVGFFTALARVDGGLDRASIAMTREQAEHLAHAWLDAWNAHDLERILAHFHDDCVFASPRVTTVMGDPSGTVHGRHALRAYWSRALALAPELRFELDHVLVGVGSLVITYRNHRGEHCAEWLRLDADGLVVEGRAHYASGSR
jgi:hypothetical protein